LLLTISLKYDPFSLKLVLLSDNQLFRVSSPRRPPLSGLEGSIVGLCITWFVLATWWLGAVHVIPQLLLLLISGLAMGLAVLAPTQTLESRIQRVNKLLRFPVFWFGVILFGYIAVQWCNPESMYFEYMGYRGLTTKDLRNYTELQLSGMTVGEFRNVPSFNPIRWLPTSVYAPFEWRNPLRIIVLYGGVWMLCCAMWIGITRRKSVHIVVSAILVNILIFSLVAILQEWLNIRKILGFVDSPAATFIGTFIYRGHGASFMNCGIVLALGMYFHYGKVKRAAESSGFILLYLVAALIMSVGVLMSASRMGIVCCGILWLIFIVFFIYEWLRHRWFSPSRIGTLILTSVFIAVIYTVTNGQFNRSIRRFETMDRFSYSVDNRWIQNQATMDMIGDRMWTGWGAGSYRWVFPQYQREYRKELGTPSRKRYHHAHNDILQPIAEMGILGCLPILGIIGFWLVRAIRNYRYLDQGVILMIIGGMVILLHAFTDPLFHSEAILGVWSMALIVPVLVTNLMRMKGLRHPFD
jgi:O-antigen ligase